MSLSRRSRRRIVGSTLVLCGLVAGLVALTLVLLHESPPPERVVASSRCRGERPPGETTLQGGDLESPRLDIRYGGEELRGALALVRDVGGISHIRGGAGNALGIGGYVADLDGDRDPEGVVELELPRKGSVVLLLSRGLHELRGDVAFADVPVVLLSDARRGAEERINGVRRTGDGDGDGRPGLVVQTSEDVCPGGCSETSPRTARLRAYVVPGRDVRPGGRAEIGTADAPLAGTRDDELPDPPESQNGPETDIRSRRWDRHRSGPTMRPDPPPPAGVRITRIAGDPVVPPPGAGGRGPTTTTGGIVPRVQRSGLRNAAPAWRG